VVDEEASLALDTLNVTMRPEDAEVEGEILGEAVLTIHGNSSMSDCSITCSGATCVRVAEKGSLIVQE